MKSISANLLHRATLRLLAGSLAGALLLGATHSLDAQPGAVNPARVTQEIDNSVLTTLKGNVHPLARSLYDKGAANASLPAERMQLVLKRGAGQEIALRQVLGSMQNPNSSQYRKWLTPEQFGAQYGVSDADIQTVSSWLASQGFKVNKVNKAKTILEFSGTVGQLQSAFHTQIHSFNVNGEQHIANISDPQIPAALSPVVAGLSSMNNFFPKPQHTKPTLGKYDKASGKLVPALTTGSAAKGFSLYLVPGDAATIYDAPNSYNTKFTGTTSYTGANVTIGIAGDSNIAITDVTEYRSLFGLSSAPPTVVVDGNDPGVNGDVVEALLDLEVSGGLAPDASQIFYTAADTNLDAGLYLAINRALDDNAVSILNVSFGGCEAFQGESGNEFINSLWEQAAAQGISVTVSTGDNGSAGCDDDNTELQAQLGLQVNGLASTPFNIAVGGTDFDVLGTNFTQYVSATDTSNYTSALGYIPEEPWNDSTDVNGMLSANVPITNSNGDTNIVAASGGASGCLNATFIGSSELSGCDPVSTTSALTGYAKPSWQTGGSLGIPSDGVRDLPDVSLFAANGLYNSSWLVCYTFTASDGTDVTCAPNGTGEFYFIGVGGTSSSAPAFAGVLALISQSQGGARLGQANYVLYNLANQTGVYGTAFHDTTVGNNSVYCVTGSLNCGTNLFENGYNTTTAYDQASGLGSVDISQLITDWPKASFAGSTTSLTINGGTAPVSITHGQAITLSATVTGAGTTPTGDVAIVSNANQQADTYNSNWLDTLTLSAGSTGGQSFSNLPGGTYLVTANYGGDIAYAQSQSVPGIQVTVAKEDSVVELFGDNGNGSFTPAGSYPYGTYFSLDAEPVGVSQVNSPNPGYATGSVVFTDTAGLPSGVSASVALNSFGYAELPIYYWSTAAHSVSASYAGDNSFNSSAATPLTFTITQAPTASTVSSSVSSVNSGTFTVTSVITPTPLSTAAYPTGTVTLTANGNTIGTGAVAGVFDSSTGASLGTVTISVNASSLAAGVANVITAAYPGDVNYTGSAGTVSVTLTTTPTLTLTPGPTAVTIASPGQSGSSTISVTPANYTGTLNVTCVLATSPTGANTTYNPTCTVPGTLAITSNTVTTTTASIATTAATSGALAYPETNRGNHWYTAAGGSALACILFFGIPARRRGWKSMLSLLVFLVGMAGVGCGGGSSSGGHTGTPGTTVGSYTFTVTATDSKTSTITATGTLNVTVN